MFIILFEFPIFRNYCKHHDKKTGSIHSLYHTHHEERVVDSSSEGHVLPSDGNRMLREEGLGTDYTRTDVPGHALPHLNTELVCAGLEDNEMRFCIK